MKRIGLYGGSFDPPHVCHVLVATYALCKADIEQLHVIPVHTHPFGKTLAPFDLRCQMLANAMEHLGPQVVINPIEEELTAPNYTIDTVRALRAKLGDVRFVFVCGTDLFESRHRWKNWDELESQLDFLVIGRGDGVPPEGFESPAELPDISSTQIRNRLKANEKVDRLVPSSVLELIRTHGLYST